MSGKKAIVVLYRVGEVGSGKYLPIRCDQRSVRFQPAFFRAIFKMPPRFASFQNM